MNREEKQKVYGEALMLIIIGILFCCFGKGMLSVMFTVIGALLCLFGIFISFANLFFGIPLLAFGVVLIVGAWVFVDVVLIIAGVLAALTGVTEIAMFIKNKKKDDLISGISYAVLGGLLIASKWGADWFFYVVGGTYILLGIIGVFLATRYEKIEERSGGKKVKPDIVDVKPIEKEEN